ncbi:MAG: ribosome biogenesis GTPase Der [Patescibacteria group bacterium]|jgi:GTP-binding protein
MPTNNLPKIVIFGRTNVGKSTLFNRLIEEDRALTADEEGTTRDSNYGRVEWRGVEFEIIDTGGIINLRELTAPLSVRQKKLATAKMKLSPDKETIDKKVQLQAREHLTRADLILFLIDAKAGMTPEDRQLALFLKEHAVDKKIILAANKTDSPKDIHRLPEFFKLGLGDPLPVSAATGSGTGDLLDEIVSALKSGETDSETPADETPAPIRVCIIGKPNVGKSSLVNSIFGRERVIVSSVPHTTREPQDTEFAYNGREMILVDTAGITRKASQSRRSRAPGRGSKVKINLEKEGIRRSLKSLNRADIALLVLDISQEITREDQRIADEIIGRKKSLIIIANKWDLVPEKDVKKYTNCINDRLPFIKWAPIIFVSALTGRRTGDILSLIADISGERAKTIGEKALDKFLKRIVKIHRPVRYRASDKYPYIRKIRQAAANPPEMEVLIGARESIDSTYLRFIENQLRDQFRFIGSPISVRVFKGKWTHGKYEKKKEETAEKQN